MSQISGEFVDLANQTLSQAMDWLADNPNWWLALLVAGGTLAALIVARYLVLAFLLLVGGRKRGTWRNIIYTALAKTTTVFLIIVALAVGAELLKLPTSVDGLIHSVLVIAVVVQAAIWVVQLVVSVLALEASRQDASNSALANAMALITAFIRAAVWSVAVLVILDNLGVNITALVAGLGIGGIAVGLAAQGVIGDLFASLSIVLDRPFVRGDFIVFGDFAGTVERTGLKTTRIRSLSGEQIVVSNSNLLAARIRNYEHMSERRVDFGLGVVYQTPADKLQKIPGMVREIVERQNGARFERCHLKSFGSSSLDYEVVYFVTSGDYTEYMDIQQAINLAIFRAFQAAGIAFAYPTQTLYAPQFEGAR